MKAMKKQSIRSDHQKNTISLSLELTRCHEDLDSMRKNLVSFLAENEVPEEAASHLELCVYELLINIVEHSLPEYSSAEMKLKCTINDSRVECQITSKGEDFDITKASMPDVREHYLSGKNHGLGVYIIKTLMDDVQYSRAGDINTVKLIKKY